MKTKTVFSKVWPIVKGETQYYIVFRHLDGRAVRYIAGPMMPNDAQTELLKTRGNLSGTAGSIHYWEAFPDEEVCQGCVAELETGTIDSDGTEHLKWGTSHPRFESGVRARYCTACRERETLELLKRFERDMKTLNIPIDK